MATWHKGFNQQELARRMEQSRSGSSFTGFGYDEHLVLLGGMIELNDSIYGIDRQRILNQACFAAAASGPITADSLLRHTTTLEADFLRRAPQRFRLLTAISIAPFLRVPSCRVGACRIAFGPKLSDRLRRSREQILKDACRSVFGELPTNYINLTVHIQARSPHEAGPRALDAIDFMRGLWNLLLNRQKGWRWSSGRPKAVNEIVLGPIHTLHKADDSPALESWWYDPGYVEPSVSIGDQGKIDRVVRFASRIREKLKGVQYASELTDAMIRYSRSLDSHDLNDAFLRLWGLLEFLTGTVSQPAAITVRRGAFPFKDRGYAAQALSHLANHRNRYVHAGADSDQIESLLFLLKRHVEAQLLFHAMNSFRFSSIEEAGQFMDLQGSKTALSERIRKLKLARKFVLEP